MRFFSRSVFAKTQKKSNHGGAMLKRASAVLARGSLKMRSNLKKLHRSGDVGATFSVDRTKSYASWREH